MKLRNVTSMMGAMALMAIASACGSKEPASTGPTEGASVVVDGLRIVEMDEADGKLVLEYTKDSRSIRYELRLGAKMEIAPSEEQLAIDPELPTFSTDARVLDGAGQVFHLQMGGDHFIDPSWRMPHVENVDEAGRAKDFGLMRDAVSALRKLPVPQGLDQLRLSAIQIGRAVDHMYEKDAIPAKAPTTGTAPSDGTVTPKSVNLAVAGSTVNLWDYRVQHHSVTSFGWHTAVQLRGWTSGYSIVFTAQSCNHGSCATDSNMSNHCTLSGWKNDDGTHSRWFFSETSTSTTRTGACATGYGWSSTYSHNCNDDAELQRDAIWHDASQDVNNNECHDFGGNTSSPNCY